MNKIKFISNTNTLKSSIYSSDAATLKVSGINDSTPVTISGLGEPIDNTDAATINYLNSKGPGLKWKSLVQGATQINIPDLSNAPSTVDTVADVSTIGDRILVFNQANLIENGIYVVQSNTPNVWIRADDLLTGSNAANATVSIEVGQDSGDGYYSCSNNTGDDIVDTDELSFFRLGNVLPKVTNVAMFSDTSGTAYPTHTEGRVVRIGWTEDTYVDTADVQNVSYNAGQFTINEAGLYIITGRISIYNGTFAASGILRPLMSSYLTLNSNITFAGVQSPIGSAFNSNQLFTIKRFALNDIITIEHETYYPGNMSLSPGDTAVGTSDRFSTLKFLRLRA